MKIQNFKTQFAANMLPGNVLQISYNYVPYEVYDYMGGLVELMLIAEETGVTVLERLQQERAMRRAYEVQPVSAMDVAYPPLFA